MVEKIISADSHFNEPIDFYSALHKRFGSSVPHICRGEDGDYWVSENQRRPLGVMNRPGQRGAGNTANLRYEETEWFTDLESRTKYVKRDGVNGEVLFPSGAMIYTISSQKIREACMTYLNEFMDSLSGFYQGVLMLPAEPKGAFDMVTRFSGRKNVFLLPLYTPNQPYFDRAWQALFEKIESDGSVIAFHAGTLDENLRKLPDHSMAKSQVFKTSRLFFQAHHLLSELILGGVFKRHPGLKILISELGCTWVDYSIHRIVEGNEIYSEFDVSQAQILQIMKNNFNFTVQFDFPRSFANSISLGKGNVLFGTDFPHVESTYGNTKNVVSDAKEFLSTTELNAIFFQNAENLFQRLGNV